MFDPHLASYINSHFAATKLIVTQTVAEVGPWGLVVVAEGDDYTHSVVADLIFSALLWTRAPAPGSAIKYITTRVYTGTITNYEWGFAHAFAFYTNVVPAACIGSAATRAVSKVRRGVNARKLAISTW